MNINYLEFAYWGLGTGDWGLDSLFPIPYSLGSNLVRPNIIGFRGDRQIQQRFQV